MQADLRIVGVARSERQQYRSSLAAAPAGGQRAAQRELIAAVLRIRRGGTSKGRGGIGDTPLGERGLGPRVPCPAVVLPQVANVGRERSCQDKGANRDRDERSQEREVTVRGRILLGRCQQSQRAESVRVDPVPHRNAKRE
jgi:hypothetical protein